ncbi:Cna B-type domain-containing protein [Aerococcaceae bacterium NML191292]|nr:Cna B-type domain-containing protein [Aerococcaceae bacterium NML191292]
MQNKKAYRLKNKFYNLFITLLLLVTAFVSPFSVFAEEAEDSTIVTEVVAPATLEEGAAEELPVEPDSAEEATTPELEKAESSEEASEKEDEEIMASPANVNGPAKELPNAIKTLTFYSGDNKLLTGDPMVHVRDGAYGLELNFDLSNYDHNLNNGDHFTFAVPAPMTILDPKTVELNDKDTSVNIATAVVESNGAEQGGTITITLKNLEEYLRVKGGNSVVAVKGFVKLNYKYERNQEGTLPINDATTNQTFNFKVQDRQNIVLGAEGEHLYKLGGVMVETPWDSPALGKNGPAQHPWTVAINRPAKEMGTLVVTDSMSLEGSPWQFIPETVQVLRVQFSEGSRSYKTLETLDAASLVAFSNNYTTLTLTIPNAGTNQYVLRYSTTAPGDGTYVWNDATITSDGETVSVNKRGDTVERKSAFSKLSAGIAIDTTFRIVLFKVDADDPTLRLPGAKFLITSDAGYNKEFISDDSGMVYADKDQLVAGRYTVTELEAPPGYIKTMEPIQVQVGKDGVVKTITNKREEITFTATKKWVNAPANRPEISLQLKRDGKPYGAPKTIAANSQDGATAVWTNLPKYQRGTTTPSVYTVEEAAVNNYTVAYKEQTATGVTVENTNNEKVEVVVTKVWEDKANKLNVRPANVTIRLMDGNQEVQTAEVAGDAAAAQWTHTFSNLPKYRADGTEITYTVDEVLPPNSRYTKSVQGTTVTNTLSFDEKITVSGKKVWNDNNNAFQKRPDSIKVNLLQNNTPLKSENVTGNGNEWTFQFTDLPKYDANGDVYNYTLTEEVTTKNSVGAADVYTSEITGDAATGFVITNTYVNQETVSVSGKKVWEDANNQDGKRPQKITVTLYINGSAHPASTRELSEANGWTYSFDALPKYTTDAQLINYTVREKSVPQDYSVEYVTTATGNDIVNKYTPGKTSVSVTKVWEDANDQDGVRPTEVQVQLLADGVEKGAPVKLNEANKWLHTWAELDQKKSGKDIVYTVKELAVEAYESAVTGDATTGFTVTNTHVPAVVSVSVNKVWEDANNQDGVRPTEVQVQLLADGVEQGEPVTLNEANKWAHTWADIAMKKSGKDIVYTVKELAVEAYESVVTGDATTGFTITNKHVPAVVSVSVNKVWEDANNQDGVRPAEVQVQLLADGVEQGEPVTLNEANKWAHTWANLDQKKAGKDIVYTVKELAVEAYESVVTGDATTGFTITNTHVPSVVTVAGKKVWNDADNKQGVRPASIKVNVLADGKVVSSKEVTEANGWAFEFTNLPEFAAGKKVAYTVTEDAVKGYTAIYEGDAVKGITVTNTYAPQLTNLMVVKHWNDGNDVDKLRPKSVEVELLMNNQPTGKKAVLNAENNWSHNFTELDKVLGGKEQTYSVKEVAVPSGYTSEVKVVDSANVILTNTHTPKPAPKQEKSEEKALPKTGETVVAWSTMTGLILLVASGLVYYVRKRQA